MTEQKRWLRIGEAAKYFDINPKTLYSLIARHRLPPGSVIRLGKAIRIDIAAIEAAEERQLPRREGV